MKLKYIIIILPFLILNTFGVWSNPYAKNFSLRRDEELSYQKTDWKTGDTITQDRLNAIENQLESLSSNDNNRQEQLDNIESSITHTEKTGAIVEMDYCGESTAAHSIIKNLSVKFSASNSGNNLPRQIYGISTAQVQFIKKDANLLQAIESEDNETNNGITFTRTNSGKLTIQGTASDTAVYFYPFSIPLFADNQAKPTITVAILNTAINDNIEISLQSYHQEELRLNTHALDVERYINQYTIATTVSGLVFTIKNGATISDFQCNPVVLYGSHNTVTSAIPPKASDREIITFNLENILKEKGYIGEYNLTTGAITNNALVLNLNELEWTVVGTPGEQYKIVTTTEVLPAYYKNGQYALLTNYKYLGVSETDGTNLVADDSAGVGYYPTHKTNSRRIFYFRIPVTEDKPTGLFVCERSIPISTNITPQTNILTPSSNELLAWADCGRITVDYYINQYEYFKTLHDTQSALESRVETLETQNIAQSNDISELEETAQSLQQTVQDIAATLDWSGKKVSIIGDSISAYPGTITLPSGSSIADPVYPSGDVSSVETMWWHQLLNYTGAELEINASQAGSRVVNANAPPNFYNRADTGDINILGNPDIIIVELGVNDAFGTVIGNGNPHVELGDYDYTTPYKDLPMGTDYFRKAYIKGMKALQSNYPKAVIIGLILLVDVNGYKCTDFYNSMIEICRTLQIPYIAISDYEKKENDSIHPNAAGMTTIAKACFSIVNNVSVLEKINKISYKLSNPIISPAWVLGHGQSMLTDILALNVNSSFTLSGNADFKDIQVTILKNNVKIENLSTSSKYPKNIFVGLLVNNASSYYSSYAANAEEIFVKDGKNYIISLDNLAIFDTINYNYYFTIYFNTQDSGHWAIGLETLDEDDTVLSWHPTGTAKIGNDQILSNRIYASDMGDGSFAFGYLIADDFLNTVNQNHNFWLTYHQFDNIKHANNSTLNFIWNIIPVQKLV